MSAITIPMPYDVDIANGVKQVKLPYPLMRGDDLAHEVQITVQKDGEAVDLSGGTCTLYGVLADKTSTAFVVGSVSTNVASATLESAFYSQSGRIELLLVVNLDGVTTTLIRITANVVGGKTDILIGDDDILPSLEELLTIVAQLDTLVTNAQNATTAANNAADAANTAAGDANTAAGAANTAAGTANDAAAAANNAAGVANSAATAADDAASAAGTAAALAETAAGDADTAAAAANAAAFAADTAADAANAAASDADDAALAADTAAAEADEATTAANAAALKIDGMTIEESSVPYGTTPQATITEVDGHKHIALQVERGPQGNNYTILGNAYATVAALEAAITNPEEGDQYNVGAEAPYNVYRWTGTAWEDQGVIISGARQYTTMPTITADMLGQVAQYVGETDTYAFGSFYAAVSDGELTPTYSWSEIVYSDSNAVSYNAQTGKTDAEKAVACANILAGQSNKNLLHNWYFKGLGGAGQFPVNQQGLTSYVHSGIDIPIFDRWRLHSGGTIALSASGLTLTNGSGNIYMLEYLENFGELDGETITISCSVNGTIYQVSGTVHAGVVETVAIVTLPNNFFMRLSSTTTALYLLIGSTTASAALSYLEKVKLEKGSYSTLANDPPPDYGEQLALCQRYYLACDTQMYPFFASDVDTIVIFVSLPVSMRITPSATFSSISSTFCAASYFSLTSLSILAITAESGSANEVRIKVDFSSAHGIPTSRMGRTNVNDLELSSEL